MTDFEKQWIDAATYKELFAKVRFEPIGSPWMLGDTGQYLMARYYRLRDSVSIEERIRTSKELGWK